MNNLITEKGKIWLKKKLKEVKFKKIKIIKEIEVSKKFGDLSENSEYQSAKKSLFFINKKIKKIEDHLSKCITIKSKNIKNKNIICFSATIKLKNLENNNTKTYKIVGGEEVNFNPINISLESPISRLLIGKSINDVICIKKLNKNIKYKIISIKY